MALFAFILFGTPSGSWAWKSISPPRFWKFSAIMSSDMLSSPFHLSSLYGTSIMWILMHVMLYQRPLKMSSVFKILFLLFQWFLLIFYNSNDSSLTQLHSNKSLKNKWKLLTTHCSSIILSCLNIFMIITLSSLYGSLYLCPLILFLLLVLSVQFNAVTQSYLTLCYRLPCSLPIPRAYSNSCPLSWWCHSTISSSVVPFSCLQSFPASGSFPMSQFFA